MKKAVLLLALALVAQAHWLSAEEPRPVLLLKVAGTIDPAQARYVMRGLDEARQMQASACVITLDTPGGLEGSVRQIVQGILNSPVPVIVYVAPRGARAAYSGCFIALAAHVAAMIPDSSIAEVRSRNVEWAEVSVQESRFLSALEAKERGVIDVLAKDLDDLFVQVEGLEVKTVFGMSLLHLQDQPRRNFSPSALEAVLHQLAHPNVAYVLLLLGIYGLIFELSTPGTIFPGVVGVALLILALVALETLEANWGGIFLIALSVLFFIADVKIPGYGVLTAGGVTAFLLGSAFLFPGARVAHLTLPWQTIGAAAAVTAAFFFFIVGAALRALRRKVTSGTESLIGAVGVAKTDLKLDGIVHVQGEEWQAHAQRPIVQGSPIRVRKLEGLTLLVEPVEG